jgi:Lhr-like helicase
MDSLTTRFGRQVFEPYIDLLKSGYRFHGTFARVRRLWEEKLASDELINGPYLEKSQLYETGEPLDGLPLDRRTKTTVRKRLGGRELWRHQTDALKLVLDGKNVVVATGTSSGKTLCYQIPILDDLVKDSSAGLRAIIIYPLNALVNDQLTEWEQILADHPGIRFARFTGQTPNAQTDYVAALRQSFREELADRGFTQQEMQQRVERTLAARLRADEQSSRLNHREAIRANPPQVLITNFSMLEYLLERPIDASIFARARLKFLVLDEAHAYRGIQATEIAFLIRRLKDRLGVANLTCIATSATLGKRGDAESERKVRTFASELFGAEFPEPNPIYGTAAAPVLRTPSFRPSPAQYRDALNRLRANPEADVRTDVGAAAVPSGHIADILGHDENLFRLRKDVLTRPILLRDAAAALWPTQADATEGLEALLEIVAHAKADQTHEDLLPTRLHYFVRAQDGLHVCLHKQCPGRENGAPMFFVSRSSDPAVPDGDCPDCHAARRKSKLVEVVSCRKCGYLFGALQDLGPRRAQTLTDSDADRAYFDSFTTELGWIGDAYWTYFAVQADLPYPERPTADDDDERSDLIAKPDRLELCIVCGKKSDKGVGDNCTCDNPHLREILVFHRQCPYSGKAKDYANLYRQEKSLLSACPNCGARNGSGIEPVHRFQESDDEMGLAMAIPLAHFDVSPTDRSYPAPRKLLCFTDHRQRAAAFPSLLEEETFPHDVGRKIVQIVTGKAIPIDLISLGEALADAEQEDPTFFLPVSRYRDEEVDAKERRNLWLAETFAYFGIPDSARESAEDFGLVAVEYRVHDREMLQFHRILAGTGATRSEADALFQILLTYMRQRKAFTLPKGRVSPDDPAFGNVLAEISYVQRREGVKNTTGWLPRINKDGTVTTDNIITDYIRRSLSLTQADGLRIAEDIWQFLTSGALLIERNGRWQLDHERIVVTRPVARFVCNRCGLVSSRSVRACCPRKGCVGHMEATVFDPTTATIIARWVSGHGSPVFSTLKSEEHTAQINKNLAKQIEERFRASSPESRPARRGRTSDDEPRIDGVNLLSSTTTFEMGINIGDLQKVLLRNAPPSSASYVQRVGRAGRGVDKNSVCVTLCRRTKYDADAWNDPPRIMSGAVRTPTVFTENRVIAQRHFNAVAFAKFLRTKLADEQLLGPVTQQIRLETFIPPDARRGIPDSWLHARPTNLYLDFVDWLKQQQELDIFLSDAGRSLSKAVSSFQVGVKVAAERCGAVLHNISEELAALMAERKKLYDRGAQISDIEQAAKSLLGSDVIGVLAKRGFLPRYAFPLDVVTLETGRTRWSRDVDVELSRDRGLAIAEFAPGAQVIAHKKVFTSAGLYVVSKMDRPRREWYSVCTNCRQIRTAEIQDSLIGPCAVCKQSINTTDVRAYVSPAAFSVRLQEKGPVRYRRSTLIRQRQALTHFIDHVDEASFSESQSFRLALMEAGTLFRYNLGPEAKGFMLCQECGCSEPLRGYKAGKTHQRLRPTAGMMSCNNDQPWIRPLAYGHRFQSYCLIARPMTPAQSVESLAYALQRGLCQALDLELADIGVSWRWYANEDTQVGQEIVLYDQAPGGAGFVQEALQGWRDVVEAAKDCCENCSCERACYDCLKSYNNQAQHDLLDRHTVAL